MNDPCVNGGSCVDDGVNQACNCPTGYVGNNCETSKNYFAYFYIVLHLVVSPFETKTLKQHKPLASHARFLMA